MKRLFLIISIITLTLCAATSCSNKNIKSSGSNTLTEDEAVERLASDIYSKYKTIENKKIGIFDFSTLEGKDTPDGKRLAKKLLESLIKKGGLKFVERSEFDKLLKAQGIEQTGIVDAYTIKESGKVLSIDIMINGTIARINNHGELSIKATDVSSGEIYLAASTKFIPAKAFSFKEDPKTLNIHRRSPEKLEIMNKAFFTLQRLSRDKPLIFLLAVFEKEEIESIEHEKPRLSRILMKKDKKIREDKPRLQKKITRLKNGLSIIKDNAPERYKIIMQKKTELINNPPSRRSFPRR